MQARLVVRAAAMATVAALSGCGGSSSSDQTAKFKTDFSPVLNEFKQTSNAIGTEIGQASSQTDAQVASAFRSLAHSWQAEVSKLEKLKPPSNLSTVFNTMSA